MPQYYIEAHQSGCFYEVYINGILCTVRYINAGAMNNAIPINDKILKSGPQKVTIKLFPLGEIDGKEYPTLTERTRFTLEIFKRDKATPWEGLDYDVVHNYFAPTTTSEEAGPFAHANEPMYEETFTFNAEVPYELTGWSDSQVIEGQEGIEQEVLDFYKEYADVIQNQDEKKWVQMVETKELEYFKSIFYNDKSSEKFKKRIKLLSLPFDSKFKKRFPLDPYEMILGGDGKVITLKNKVKLGKSAFSFGVEEIENGESYKYRDYPYLFLHKPKGSDKLEIIR
ncbi:hypothetical protein [Zobellia uliginosa]|uniref:hypothetical protein n=1 Tax=Zobellia uliginosa TaxID=143224 RepID=UPI0026E44FCB|nr:hypothetical protein [Zobellia uliginosa]MDO6519045.1 hypothetical protein [Zobellia uliginosa]